MPYISKERRAFLRNYNGTGRTPGDLNYEITQLCDAYLLAGGVCYDNINAVIGVLECAKLEYYRRIGANYEDKKCAENGDVYSPKNLTAPQESRVTGEVKIVIPDDAGEAMSLTEMQRRVLLDLVGVTPPVAWGGDVALAYATLSKRGLVANGRETAHGALVAEQIVARGLPYVGRRQMYGKSAPDGVVGDE